MARKNLTFHTIQLRFQIVGLMAMTLVSCGKGNSPAPVAQSFSVEKTQIIPAPPASSGLVTEVKTTEVKKLKEKKTEVPPQALTKTEGTLSADPIKIQTFASSHRESETGTATAVVTEGTSTSVVHATITLKKSRLYDQKFFYGVDLQFSSIVDKDLDLYSQAQAEGLVPAYFRRNGQELQLVADNRRLYPSDVNHPDTLISRYPILSETNDTLVVGEGNSSVYLSNVIDSKQHQPRDYWTRSFQFVSEGDYFLQETTIVMADGSVSEVMESLFPQSTLAVSENFQRFELDPARPPLAKEGPGARYRFIPGDVIHQGESKVALAQHFDLFKKDGSPTQIEWYVTANIKDEHLPIIRDAIEGWNRYFKKMKSLERLVLVFKGRLPNGVKLGDPRYNVVSWDNRLIAGAAYESAATDPFTGKSSHALIYLPSAWFQIGTEYWTNGQFSENEKSVSSAPSRKLTCARDLSAAAEAIHVMHMDTMSAEAFAKTLLKQTLFHEIGHSLGLNHNFKGSLSFDRSKPDSMFSTSIMDYNYYSIERAAFTEGGEGPLLEYDRQALSALYNKMVDVKSSDPVLPACSDEEADTDKSGVDPLCNRYDIEKDPTLSIGSALKRITEAHLSGEVTLSESLDNVPRQILKASALKATDTKEKQLALQKSFVSALYGVLRYYYVTGKQSLSLTVKKNLKSLYGFEENILPQGYVEKEMRDRSFAGVKAVFEMKDLAEAVKFQLKMSSTVGSALLMKTAYVQGLPPADVGKLQLSVTQDLESGLKDFMNDGTKGMLRLHQDLYRSLVRKESLPLFFGKIGETAFDFEVAVSSILFEAAMDPTRNRGERLEAAKALKTYSGRLEASELIKKLHDKVQAELTGATKNETREFAISLQNSLN